MPKKNSVVAYVERGPVVDESAMIEALRTGKLKVPLSMSSLSSLYPNRHRSSLSQRSWKVFRDRKYSFPEVIGSRTKTYVYKSVYALS